MAALLARACLTLSGWHPLDRRTLSLLAATPRAISPFPHTSYSDFFLALLYFAAYPDLLGSRACYLIKPQALESWPLLSRLGAVAASRLEEKGKGTVKKVVDLLSPRSSFFFLLSPKGTVEKREWSSGYYHLARELEVPLLVSAFDYAEKKVLLFPPLSPDLPEVAEAIRKSFSLATPRYPEREVVDCPNSSRQTVVDWYRLFLLQGAVSLVLLLAGWGWTLGALFWLLLAGQVPFLVQEEE